MQKEIPIGDVLSITTGNLVSRDHMGGVYNICDFMTGQSNFTHQLPYVSKQILPEILKQHPYLASIVVPEWNFQKSTTNDERKQIVLDWLEKIENQYGATILLSPMQYENQL